MTSPAQLKYLQAMGIPVWVSRELVFDEEIEESSVSGSLRDSANESDSLSVNVSASETLGNHAKNNKKAAVSSAVSNILHDLEAQDPPKRQSGRRSNAAVSASEDSAVIIPDFKVIANTGVNLLAQTEQHNIYACGNLQADWLVIGESPEFINDDTNQPYAGDAGILLGNMLKAVGIQNPRSEAYLINIFNRSQQQTADQKALEELHQLLHNTITQIKPKMLLVTGQVAAQNILQTKEPLVRLRGKSHTFSETDIPVVVTYYPSYLLSKPLDKRKAWEDLKLAMSLLQS